MLTDFNPEAESEGRTGVVKAAFTWLLGRHKAKKRNSLQADVHENRCEEMTELRLRSSENRHQKQLSSGLCILRLITDEALLGEQVSGSSD